MRRPVMLPLLLLVIGLLLLLDNLGVLPAGFWTTLSSLWPILLIIAGADMLLARPGGGGATVGRVLLIATILAGATAYAWLTAGPVATGMSQTSMSTPVTYDVSAEGTHIVVDVELANLLVNTSPFDPPRVQVAAVNASDRDWSLRTNQKPGELIIRPVRSARFRLPRSVSAQATWVVTVPTGVPLSLAVDMGVGRATLHLADADISHLELDGGVGGTEVTLPRRAGHRTSVDAGVGTVDITAPADLPGRLLVASGVGARDIAPRFIARRDGVYETEGFQDGHGFVINVDLGVGTIRVR